MWHGCGRDNLELVELVAQCAMMKQYGKSKASTLIDLDVIQMGRLLSNMMLLPSAFDIWPLCLGMQLGEACVGWVT